MRKYTLPEVMVLLQGAEWKRDLSWGNPAFETTIVPYTFRLVDFRWGTQLNVFTSEGNLIDIFSGSEIDDLWNELTTEPSQLITLENMRADFNTFLHTHLEVKK